MARGDREGLQEAPRASLAQSRRHWHQKPSWLEEAPSGPTRSAEGAFRRGSSDEAAIKAGAREFIETLGNRDQDAGKRLLQTT